MIESFRIMARMKKQGTVSVTVSETVGHKKGQRQKAGERDTRLTRSQTEN